MATHLCRELVLLLKRSRIYKCRECGQKWMVSGGDKETPLKAEKIYRVPSDAR